MPVEKIAPEEREAILRVAHVAHIDEDTNCTAFHYYS